MKKRLIVLATMVSAIFLSACQVVTTSQEAGVSLAIEAEDRQDTTETEEVVEKTVNQMESSKDYLPAAETVTKTEVAIQGADSGIKPVIQDAANNSEQSAKPGAEVPEAVQEEKPEESEEPAEEDADRTKDSENEAIAEEEASVEAASEQKDPEENSREETPEEETSEEKASIEDSSREEVPMEETGEEETSKEETPEEDTSKEETSKEETSEEETSEEETSEEETSEEETSEEDTSEEDETEEDDNQTEEEAPEEDEEESRFSGDWLDVNSGNVYMSVSDVGGGCYDMFIERYDSDDQYLIWQIRADYEAGSDSLVYVDGISYYLEADEEGNEIMAEQQTSYGSFSWAGGKLSWWDSREGTSCTMKKW